jgi:hypothetical protein
MQFATKLGSTNLFVNKETIMKVAVIIRQLSKDHAPVLSGIIRPTNIPPEMSQDIIDQRLTEASQKHVGEIKSHFVEFRQATFVMSLVDEERINYEVDLGWEPNVKASNPIADPANAIESLDIDPKHLVRALNCLIHAGGITTISQLVTQYSAADLQKVPNLGPKMILSIMEALKKRGLELQPVPAE